MARKRSSHFDSSALSTTFAGLIRDREWEQKFDQHRIFPEWKNLVDEETAAYSRPLKVVKDILWLEVENSAWVQQLQFKKIMLLETLNSYLTVSYFSDIRFTVKQTKKSKAKPAGQQVHFIPPSSEEIEQFKKQLEFIDDEDIKESMTRLWYLSHACKRS